MLVCFALVAAVGLTGCNKNNDPPVPPVTTVTVTFVQMGEENIVKTVEFGGTLTDIPTPAARDGFIVAWDRTDFSGLVEDITVYRRNHGYGYVRASGRVGYSKNRR